MLWKVREIRGSVDRRASTRDHEFATKREALAFVFTLRATLAGENGRELSGVRVVLVGHTYLVGP